MMLKISKHDSTRGYFAYELFNEMNNNQDIYVITADLGYGMFDYIKKEYPQNFINCGAAEQLACGLAIGMTYEKKIPIYYSITSFGFFRPIEWIRNYVNKEYAPIKMVFSGRDRDYGYGGFTHWAEDVKQHLDLFVNIKQYWPNKEDINSKYLREFLYDDKPGIMILGR
jgi:transketolase C-terminal domain/subunit